MDQSSQQAFSDLEARIRKRLSEFGDHKSHLAAAAVAALEDLREQAPLDVVQCLNWFLAGVDLPTQNWDFDFGQPAVTIISNDVFRVDLLYWVQNATPIHDHVTCGAFMALKGARLHGTYEFAAAQELDDYVALGALTRNSLELMREGDVREIRPDLIHDLYWLGKPSVTLVVRCADHPSRPIRKPREYWIPGIAYVNARHHDTAKVQRQSEALRLLRQAAPSRYAAALRTTLTSDDACLRYYGFLDAAVALPEALDTVTEQLGGEMHDPLMAALLTARTEMRRRSLYGGVYVADDAGQLAAALRWAGAGPAEAAAIIRDHSPGADPTHVLADAIACLRKLSDDVAQDVSVLARQVA